MFQFLATAVAATLVATPASAPAPNEVTIVVDMRAQCYMGRIADGRNAAAERQAREVARELKAQGKSVKIVRAYGTVRTSAPHQIDVRAPSC